MPIGGIMRATFEETIAKAIKENVVAGAAVIAGDKTGTLCLSRVPRVQQDADGVIAGTGTTRFVKAFGSANFTDGQKPMQLDSTMWLASCTRVYQRLKQDTRGQVTSNIDVVQPDFYGSSVYAKCRTWPALSWRADQHLSSRVDRVGHSDRL